MPVDKSPELGIRAPNYRLPESTRLGPVCLQVSDLVRSVEFYQGVLGFRLLEQSTKSALLGTGDQTTPLVRLVEARGAEAVPPRGHLGLFHVAFLLPDRESFGRFVKHLVSRKIRFGSADHLVSEAIYLTDPDGLGIEVYADRPRSSWASDGNQIAMATEPLDVVKVTSHAGDDPWKSAPANTRVGHIHLRVGDLERSARFYHNGLGLDKTVWRYPGALFLSAGGYHHHVGLNTWGGTLETAKPDDARLVEWTLVVPEEKDVVALSNSLERLGFAVTRSTDELRVVDPSGIEVRIITTTIPKYMTTARV